MDCAKTIELREKRYQRACMLLQFLINVDHKCKTYQNTIENLVPYAPSCSLLNFFAKNNNLQIKSPTSIEKQRRKKCNISTIGSFYEKNKEILKNTNPHFLWNADESSLTSSRKFKVLAGKDIEVFESRKRFQSPHITTMFAYNAMG